MVQRSIVASSSDKNALRKGEALAKKIGTKVTRGEPVASLTYTWLDRNPSCAAPSKAFLEDQADRDQAEREKAERKRSERELAKKTKHQSYEDFPPISTSELDCAVSLWQCWLDLLLKQQFQNVKLKNFVREGFQKICYPRCDKVWSRSPSL